MKQHIFGIDGIRGQANKWPLTAEVALDLGMAAGTIFKRGKHRPHVIIGKDTRRSGYMIEYALVSGFVAVGMDVKILGPIPSPAIGSLTRSLRADLGVMISGSDNEFQDNGLKLFGSDGFELAEPVEREIERLLDEPDRFVLAPPNDIGLVKSFEDSVGRYVEFAKGAFPRGMSLDGLRIVLDCANGAAYKAAPRALWELGAEVVEISVAPNGTNINQLSGATNTKHLRKVVLERRADIGIALNGDADRVVIIDEKGREIDGDQIIGAIARDMVDSNTLRGSGVVTTTMSNSGLEKFLERKGTQLIRTGVGAREVIASMRQNGCNLGGEQSGQIVLLDSSTTKDGLIAALRVLSSMSANNRPASETLNVFEPAYQSKKSLPYVGASPLSNPNIQTAVQKAQTKVASCGGRLVVLTSSTESVVRMMAEGEEVLVLDEIIDELYETLLGN